jgi:hypothetical protein
MDNLNQQEMHASKNQYVLFYVVSLICCNIIIYIIEQYIDLQISSFASWLFPILIGVYGGSRKFVMQFKRVPNKNEIEHLATNAFILTIFFNVVMIALSLILVSVMSDIPISNILEAMSHIGPAYGLICIILLLIIMYVTYWLIFFLYKHVANHFFVRLT